MLTRTSFFALTLSLVLGCSSEGAGPEGTTTGTTGTTTGTGLPAESSTGGTSSSSGSGGASTDGSGGTTTVEVTGTRIDVSDVAGLRAALLAAVPGDQILLAAGTYAPTDTLSLNYAGSGRNLYFYSQASGESDAPIIIESADPSNPAVIEGLGTTDSAYLLWLAGENWVVRNLVLQNGGKGLILDEASGSVVDGVEVYDIGDEAIHLRSGTSNAVIENCTIDRTGLEQPGYGEGIYIGSDRSVWDNYNPTCDNNTIRGCTIRGTTAEAIDVKEGTTGTVIESCSIYGGSVSGDNSADSFIDLKGNGALVHDNAFYKEGNALVTRGVALVDRTDDTVVISSCDNWIFDNTYEMDDGTGYMVYAYAGTDNHAWDNTRNPAGEEYKGNDPELYLTDPR